ncbi:DUF2206 domain-containing protein [uncultured Methanobacterium sp.]|uniref:DUF2206 domain-containing protein n=1 Tax=uncultured Methanobacterium sp. TaxID=176306 RepID=UPI002AA7629C|nr:DUF2206 domain-containing protein [uncultured Methanobacterium sp.]
MLNKRLNSKYFLTVILLFIFCTDILVYFNVPGLREIFGFIFLTVLPGMLIVNLLHLDRLNLTEKIVLSWGISLSFVTMVGLLINSIILFAGHTNALSLDVLLIFFNSILIALALANYFCHKDSSYRIPSLSFNTLELAIITSSFYLVLISIVGVYLLEKTGNNILLMILFLAIAIFVSLIILFRDKFPKRLYPMVIFFIGLSILLIMSLRSHHIMGSDIHLEYNLFQNTLINNYWKISDNPTVVDACITISLLPAIYQKILNIAPEMLFKFLFVILFSISPVLIYLISNKYVKKDYSFLAAFFFMSQLSFFTAESNPRTNLAILFVMLAVMVFFNDKISLPKKRLLFIVFLISCVLSHYSTSYIFFIILFLSLLVTYLSTDSINLSKYLPASLSRYLPVNLGRYLPSGLTKYLPKGAHQKSKDHPVERITTLNMVILFFSIMFLWYAQITQKAFGSGVSFFKTTLTDLFINFFISESRGTQVQALVGQGILDKAISAQIEFVFTWLLLGFIGLGILAVLVHRKKIIFTRYPGKNLFKRNIDFEFFIMAFISSILLLSMVILPHIAKGYSMDRLYLLTSTFLSLFFILGGVILADFLGRLKNQENVQGIKGTDPFRKGWDLKSLNPLGKGWDLKSLNPLGKGWDLKSLNPLGKGWDLKSLNPLGKGWDLKSIGKSVRNILSIKNSSPNRGFYILLLILVPYFLCVSGFTYNLLGENRSVLSNSNVESYYESYITDGESAGAEWLGQYRYSKSKIRTDHAGAYIMYSQGNQPFGSVDEVSLSNSDVVTGYIYLRNRNVDQGVFVWKHNIKKINSTYYGKYYIKIYDSGNCCIMLNRTRLNSVQ